MEFVSGQETTYCGEFAATSIQGTGDEVQAFRAIQSDGKAYIQCADETNVSTAVMDSIFGKLVTGTFHVGALGFPDTVKLSGQVSITCDYRCEHTFKDFFYYENTAYWALHVLIDADPHYSLVNVETTKCHSYIP